MTGLQAKHVTPFDNFLYFLSTLSWHPQKEALLYKKLQSSYPPLHSSRTRIKYLETLEEEIVKENKKKTH
jgi:hypothetical protein